MHLTHLIQFPVINKNKMKENFPQLKNLTLDYIGTTTEQATLVSYPAARYNVI